MTTPRAKGTPVPEDFKCDDKTLAWIGRRYPNLDVELAEERFCAWACAGGYLYLSHQQCFKNFVIREDDNGRIGKLMKKTQVLPRSTQIKLWDGNSMIETQLMRRGKDAGFRPPNSGETFSQYESALKEFQIKCNANVTKLSSALK